MAVVAVFAVVIELQLKNELLYYCSSQSLSTLDLIQILEILI